MHLNSAPIVAIATATGRGAVGIVRLSGANLAPIAKQITKKTLLARQATLTEFFAEDGSIIDKGLAIYFPAPHSYTGEDVLELQAHGGPAVLQLLVNTCLHYGQDLGLRLAEAGEFTQRAYINNKMDLTQAEAVADLIEANTASAAKAAAQSLTGAFSVRIDELQELLIHTRMLVEANLDFPEEDIDSLDVQTIIDQLQSIQLQIAAIQQEAKQGALLRDGIRVVLAGQPNVGKSSLLNALAGAELAIVTDIAGTTRDTKEQYIQINGVPLHIVDTAGLRESNDTVEQIGIERAWKAVTQADIIILLHDGARHTAITAEQANHTAYLEQDEQLLTHIQSKAPQTPLLHVWNKSDAVSDTTVEQSANSPKGLWISAKAQLGLKALRQSILQIAGYESDRPASFSARQRHVQATEKTLSHVHTAQELLHSAKQEQSSYQLDLVAEELRLAQQFLSTITGEFTPDDLLGTIFAKFCIGK